MNISVKIPAYISQTNYPAPLKRPRLEFRKPCMTVCLAAVCRAPTTSKYKYAVVCASDRMLTSGDVEYEPQQQKTCELKEGTILFVSGNMQVHSEAIRAIETDLKSNDDPSVRDISELYGHHIRKLRARWAAYEYLAPFELDQASFLEKQAIMSPDVVADLVSKISKYAFDVEAIVAGMNDDGTCDIFHINGNGLSVCQTDIGFVSIGIGADHANLQLMSQGYSRHSVDFYAALSLIYAAKKSSELAPGVGKETDIFFMVDNQAQRLNSAPKTILDQAYIGWQEDLKNASDKAISSVRKWFLNMEENRLKAELDKLKDENDSIQTT